MIRRFLYAMTASILLSMGAAGAGEARPQSQRETTSAAPADRQAQTSPPATRPAHWATVLGLRSAQVTHVMPLIDRVVLVPDAATFLDELAKWSPAAPDGTGGRWPVLFEDDQFASMFVRRFQPRELIRRDSINASLPENQEDIRRTIEQIVVKCIGGDPASQSIAQAFADHRYKPPGVVVASTRDSAWPAAAALAAGHLQPIIWLDDDLGDVNGELDDAHARSLHQRITSGINDLGYSWRALGDDIDAITLCRSAPVATRLNLPADQRLKAPAQFADGPVALTDYLGRNDDGSRYAMTGWIFGDQTRTAYMAMCSLFLPRTEAALINTYSTEGEWGVYSTAGAAEMLNKGGFTVTEHAGDADAGETGWQRSLPGGWQCDLVMMNSGGNADFFVLAGGAQARPGDVPVLNHPSAVHLIHSWSLRSPRSEGSVGGRWLAHGAYAMVGSCHEPFLAAFTPPRALAARWLMLMPFLPAARRMAEDGASQPWRVVTIGDPLMLVPPPVAPQPVQPPRTHREAGYGLNLHHELKTMMTRADAEADIEAFAQAIHILDMLGEDEIAVQMWRLSRQKNVTSGRVAAAALPALFRRRDIDGFALAWRDGGPRTTLMRDMFWHLAGGRLAGGIDREVLTELESAIRPDDPATDCERLAPALIRVFGREHAQQVIDRVLSNTIHPEQQNRMRDLLARIRG